MAVKKDLTLFDLTNIVVGSIVGADIYIASALTAGLVGPFSIIVWLIAGLFATTIALVFAYCSYYVPKVGGPFAFVSRAFDDFYGFLTGWSIWIAEILALPVFAIAFTKYLQYFISMNSLEEIAVKGLFLFALTFVNIIGVKAAGRVNDILTLVKLSPLILMIFGGIALFIADPGILSKNYIPLLPMGLKNVGTAIVLVFWAYVGFEMGTLPASEVKNPGKTIPKAIITGMAIVMAFYLSSNFVVYGTVSWRELAGSVTPLLFVGSAIFGSLGAVIMGTGALVSVAGSDEAGVLGTARLSYAMSIDGLFPKLFSRIHKKYGTPHMGLIAQGIVAFSLSIFSGLSGLISFSVFALSFAFLLVSLSLVVLKNNRGRKLHGQNVIPWLGIAISLYLMYSTSIFDKVIGSLVVLAGVPIYVFFSPKVDIYHMKKLFVSEQVVLMRRLERKEKFLANFIGLLHRLYNRILSLKL